MNNHSFWLSCFILLCWRFANTILKRRAIENHSKHITGFVPCSVYIKNSNIVGIPICRITWCVGSFHVNKISIRFLSLCQSLQHFSQIDTDLLRLRYKYTYHGLETSKELVQAEIIAIKESYRHGQKKTFGGNFRTCSSFGLTKWMEY